MYVGKAIFINFFFLPGIILISVISHLYASSNFCIFFLINLRYSTEVSFYSCFVVLKKNKDLMSYSFAANCNCMHSFEVFVMWDIEWIKQLWGSYSVAIMDLKVCVSKCLLLNTLMLLMWSSTFSHLGG